LLSLPVGLLSGKLLGGLPTENRVVAGVGAPGPPTGAAAQPYTATVASLRATSTTVQWYAAAGGSPLDPSTPLANGSTYYATQTVNGCESLTRLAETAAAPLPVELTSFTATLASAPTVRLAWATASEKNSQSFEVKRSLDGRTFARIGTVAAAGSSSPRSYELPDAQLPAGASTLYYRLRLVDLDGAFSYSPVRSVALPSLGAGLLLYPNPAPGGTATLLGATPGAAVTVADALGRQVTAATADATGTAALALPAGLPAGVYVVRADSKAVRLTVE
jgi:hypothetical protein